MTKTARAVHLAALMGLLAFLNWYVYRKFSIPSGDAAIWFHAGLFMIVVGSYWVEVLFTKPADTVVNGLVVYVSVSTLNAPPMESWWEFLRWGGLGIAAAGFSLILFPEPASRAHLSRIRKLLYTITTTLGSARVIFSVVFFLALLSYFDTSSKEAKAFVLAWLIIILSKELKLAELINMLVRGVTNHQAPFVGRVSRFTEPNLVRFMLHDDATCRKGDIVAFTEGGEISDHSPLGLVTGHRRAADKLEVECLIIDSGFKLGSLDSRQHVVLLDTTCDKVALRLAACTPYARAKESAGFSRAGSDISLLQFEYTADLKLEEGHLVTGLARDMDVYYQITNAKIQEEKTIEGSERAYTQVTAVQLGTWSEMRQGFESYAWVAEENSPVFHVTKAHNVAQHQLHGFAKVGSVPNSNFPINVHLEDLVLYHAAILGVTGGGKSYLAYSLIEQVAARGIKVICLDVTGDYKRHLHGAVMLQSPKDVEPFLSCDDGPCIGIVEFSEKRHPIDATHMISEIVLGWCSKNRAEQDFLSPRAKVWIVLEEAHTLVPEWNFNPEKSLQDKVNKTAQIVLQARKYGLGFCVVTQRTANVTKSILNQCNSIFSFQAFDETGFDFLRNYMGSRYVEALPNLKKRHGVLVGKASCSSRPVIVRFLDQERAIVAKAPESWADCSHRRENALISAESDTGERAMLNTV